MLIRLYYLFPRLIFFVLFLLGGPFCSSKCLCRLVYLFILRTLNKAGSRAHCRQAPLVCSVSKGSRNETETFVIMCIIHTSYFIVIAGGSLSFLHACVLRCESDERNFCLLMWKCFLILHHENTKERGSAFSEIKNVSSDKENFRGRGLFKISKGGKACEVNFTRSFSTFSRN